MCEIALRAHPEGSEETRLIAGINFLENYLQLYNLEDPQMCLKQVHKPAVNQFTVVPFPFAPMVLDKIEMLYVIVPVVVSLMLIGIILIYCTAPMPRQKPGKEENNAPAEDAGSSG